MGNIGGRLRQARQEAGLSLEQVSARTKIKESILDAIEREDFGQLPRGLFRRGFLRAYAREVCLDAESIVRQYATEFEPDTTPPAAALPTDGVSSEQPTNSSYGRKLRVATLLLGVTALFVYFNVNDNPDVGQTPGVDPSATTGGGDANPSDHLQKPPPHTRPGTANWQKAEQLTLEIVPTRVVWVEATADGKRVLYQLIHRGDRKTVHARGELVVRVGDAAAFQYWLNGERGRPLGGPTEVRDIRITRDNYTTFQAP